MKKIILAFVILLNICLLASCTTKDGTTLSEGQQKAVKNSIEFIKDTPYISVNKIDTSVIKIENATENTWKNVAIKSGEEVKENQIDLTDWVITIGNRSEGGFAVIICDSSTFEVIGYIAYN
jgi:predicted metalloprotease